MKNLTKAIVTAAIIIAGTNVSFAQATATASASATIITPITIVKTIDMNFGNVAVSASLAGTVVWLQPVAVPQAVQVVLLCQLLQVLLALQALPYLASLV